MSVVMATPGGAVDVGTPIKASPTFVAKESQGHYNNDPTISFQGKEVFRSGTPDTYLPDFPTNPDISIQCKKCGMFIQLFKLKDHRYYHTTLSLLKYKGNNRPETTESLFHRRNAILRKLKSVANSEKPIDPRHIKLINEAYEYLKADLDGSLEEFRNSQDDIDTNVHGVAINSSCPCLYAVGLCSTANDRWKSYMEDTRVFQDCFGGDPNKSFLGLYDGHHGQFAAEMCANELHGLLLNEMLKFDPQTKSIIPENAVETHPEMSRNDSSNAESSFIVRELAQNCNVNTSSGSLEIVRQVIKMCEEKYETLTRENTNISRSKSPEVSFNLKDDSCRKKLRKSPMAEKMEAALTKAYHLMDIFLSYGKDERSRVRWSGCSALTAIIQSDPCEKLESKTSDIVVSPDQNGMVNVNDANSIELERSENRAAYSPPRRLGFLYLANAGNVQAVLIRGNRAYRLSKEHTPNNTKERERVMRAGGTISESRHDGRVNGIMTATRGLGNHGDKSLKKCVLVNPYTTTVPIDQYAQILVLASSGVWDVFTYEEAAQFVSKLLPSNYIPPLATIDMTLQSLLSGHSESKMHMKTADSKKLSFSSSDVGHNGNKSTKSAIHTAFSAAKNDSYEVRSCNPELKNQKSPVKSESSPIKSDKSMGGGDAKPSDRSKVSTEMTDIRNKVSDNGKSDPIHIASGDGKEADVIATISTGMVDITSSNGIRLPNKQRLANNENSETRETRAENKVAETFQGKRGSCSTPYQISTSPSSALTIEDKGNLTQSKIRFQSDGTYCDMKTEVGSCVNGDGSEDSGNEADVETNDDMSRQFSHLSEYGDVSSRDQIRREVAKTMAEHLVQAALLAGAKDNITVVVALLPGCGL